MEVPAVSIKIKGLQAIEALGGKGGLLAGLKAKGGAAAVKLGELEAKRVLLTKKGALILGEVEGNLFGPKAATLGKGALGTKGAMVAKGAAATATTAAPSTLLSAKGLGWSLGLGGLGPWLALGALCMTATGVYLYVRERRAAAASGPDEVTEFEPIP